MITFVTWKWHTPGVARVFLSEHVNVLRAMVSRHYDAPHRFVCITDDPAGLDPRVEAMPLPVRFDELTNPRGARFPNCYCRLWNFSRDAAVLGERIFQLDIDVVITADLRPLIEHREDFVGWTDKRFETHKIAGGAYMLRTGSWPEIWDDFDPARSPALAKSAGFFGSDQGWMSYRLQGQKARYGRWKGAGLMKINWTEPHARQAPAGARMVFTSGENPPWHSAVQRRYPWIKKHWRL